MNLTAILFFFIQLCFIKINADTCRSESYKIRFTRNEIRTDCIISKGEWESADSIKGFIAPWNNDIYDETVFKALHNSVYLYFCFKVKDDNITLFDYKEELTVGQEDRVELFFSPGADIKRYFCAEMDPQGKILDYSARYHRKFDESWNFSQLSISSKITPSGYIVEGSIPLAELRKMGLGDSFYMGIFRADYRSKNEEDVIWHSWIKPQSPTADFHIPSAFGLVKLEPVD